MGQHNNNNNNSSNPDFFFPLMENNFSKIFCIIFEAVFTVVTIPAAIGIIWFIKTSSKIKETLINRFVVRAVIVGFEYVLLVQVSKTRAFHLLRSYINT